MGTDNIAFLEVIEWFDESGQGMVHRIPEKGSGHQSRPGGFLAAGHGLTLFHFNEDQEGSHER
jgi:hypothetical protein